MALHKIILEGIGAVGKGAEEMFSVTDLQITFIKWVNYLMSLMSNRMNLNINMT